MASKSIFSRARPIRIAFFIEENQHVLQTLDAIFRRCFGFWGGRFSLIVPCEQGRPKASYRPWLETFDPDVIYSYVDLDQAVVEQLHEQLYPSFLTRHLIHNNEIDAHSLLPRLPIDPLKVSTLLPLAAGPAFFEAAQPARVIDSMGTMSGDAFTQDNFGSWTASIGSSFAGHLRQYGHVLSLIADGELEPRQRYLRAPDESVSSSENLLLALSTSRTVSVSHLSAMFAPRLDITNSTLGREFNIVVGDHYNDRLFFWNARSHFPKWRDHEFVDLRIPTSMLDQPSKLEAIGNFLRTKNNMTGNGGGGTPYAAIRSSSVPQERLEALAATLRPHHQWAQFRVQQIENADICVPTAEGLSQSNFVVSENFGSSSSVWSESKISDDEIRIIAPAPDHLRYCSTNLLNPHEGTWAVDVDIERQVDYSRLSNVAQRWRLPRRLRMTSNFVRGYQIQSPYGQYMHPRVERLGRLALYANSGAIFPAINQPKDSEVFVSALMRGKEWEPFVHDPQHRTLPQLCRGFRRSENGRYFWGVLQMFGGLNEANRYLLSKFWQRQFERLGASASVTDERRAVVGGALKNRFRDRTIEFTEQGDLDRLANIVLQQAEQQRTFVPTLSWYDLQKAFEESQEREWTRNPPAGPMAENELAEFKKAEMREFISSVEDLSHIGVLHQGYEHKCDNCLHRSWIGIDRVGKELSCEVCQTAEAAPVNRPWQFRLNEFVREALRKHGILPVFWALSELRERFQEQSFFFEGPSDIWINNDPWEAPGPDTDLDLVCVSNGKVSICEVKQSARQVKRAQDFSALIRHLRPDVGVIAVMEESTPRITQAFSTFQRELAGTEIESRLLTYREPEEDFFRW